MSESQVFKVVGPGGAKFTFFVKSFRVRLHAVSSARESRSFTVRNDARVVDGFLPTWQGEPVPFCAPELAAQVNAWLDLACTREKIKFSGFKEMEAAWLEDRVGEGRAGGWWRDAGGGGFCFYKYRGVGSSGSPADRAHRLRTVEKGSTPPPTT